MRSAHIICGKCGSTEVHFRIQEPCTLPEMEDCGVALICSNCGELTGIEELNEQLAEEQGYRRPK